MAKPTSPIGRVSFPSVFKVNEFEGRRKFEITLLFDKNDPGLEPMKAAAREAIKEKWKDKVPKELHNPFKDGDEIAEEKDRPEYKGKVAVKFSCPEDRPPQVVDQRLNRIDADSGAFYAGCYAKVTYTAFAFEHKSGKKGVMLSLGNVQKTGDGEAFDGRSSAEDDFEAVADAAPSSSGSDLF